MSVGVPERSACAGPGSSEPSGRRRSGASQERAEQRSVGPSREGGAGRGQSSGKREGLGRVARGSRGPRPVRISVTPAA